MTAPHTLRLDTGPVDARFWPSLAAAVVQWLESQGAPARDAIVLLPQASQLAPARAGFARQGGWQPRVETPATLAASLRPPVRTEPGLLSGDRIADRLAAAPLLASVRATDRRVFRSIVNAFVTEAQALHDASGQVAPAARAAWWDALRQALPPLDGPGATERHLARIAVEWAAQAEPPATDVLRTLRPSAWVVLQAGGVDALPLLPDDATPRLLVATDPPAAQPFDAAAQLPAPRCVEAAGLEDEALAATLCVIEALDQRATSVALIAQDRFVVRRIRALLERAGVVLDDETGWTLSTTRAAARLMAWLRAAQPGAGQDARIEALRAENAPRGAVDALETQWRAGKEAPDFAHAVADDHARRVEAWTRERERSLARWLQGLRDAVPGLLVALQTDAAGRQVVDLLGLGDAEVPWRASAQGARMDLAALIEWVDDTLEGSTWRPAAMPGARVAIVPLTRAVLRPFDAVVFPGCDAQHTGRADASPGLLPSALAREVGLDDAARRREREQMAFAHLLRVPRLTLLRRRHDAGEELAPSPLLERAMLARRRLGQPLPETDAMQVPQRTVTLVSVERPAPAMADALPERLSASAVKALRECPYQFFARALGLRERDELEGEIEAGDYGNWVHGLLLRFHATRTGADDRSELIAAADAEQAERGLDDAALWPFRTGFDRFATLYLDWLATHESDGWRFESGEVERRIAPAALGGIELEGRIDRIDRHTSGAAMLVDYKTGRPDPLKERLRNRLEDTQLAVYAAVLDEAQPPPKAIYLALSERKPPEAIEHPDVADSARALVEGLGADLQALRDGAGAPALGEGEVCRFCAARGLCRRDHWGAA